MRQGMYYSAPWERRTRLRGWRYDQAVMSSNPAYYWRLDELSGTTAVGRIGGVNGTYTGGYTLGAPGALRGDASAGASFNGSTGYVSLSTIDLSGAALSAEVWCYPTAYASPASSIDPFSINVSGNVLVIDFIDSSGGETARPRVTTYNGSSYYTCSWADRVPRFNWYHVVGTFTSTAVILYVNGLQASPAASSGSAAATGAANIGRNSGYGYFAGTIDEVALYRRALDYSEVLDHYRAGIRL